MPRTKEDREQALIILLVLYILGIALLMSGVVWGIIAVGLGILLTIGLFPQVGEFIQTFIEEILGHTQKRKTATTPTSETLPISTVKPEITQKPSEVEEIIAKIQEFEPFRKPNSERDLEYLLMQDLKRYFPNLRTELQYERTQIDAQIGKIGIELKYQPSESQLDRLYGQIEKYLQHLDYVIVVIGYELSPESTDHFRRRIKRSNWDDRVFVVTK